jgi:cysteine desulfurase/selenocysteine lyase
MNRRTVEQIRQDFPILHTEMQGKPLAYLDNGATTQKPQAVIDAISHYYTHDNANVHRGLYELSERATDAYESARRKVADFIGASAPEECIFTRGTTDSINMVAASWGRKFLHAGDEVIVSGLEHHSNIVPWQLACESSGADLRVWQPDAEGELQLSDLEPLLSDRTKMIAVQHVSNALGSILDVGAVCRIAKKRGAVVLIDGAQWVGHQATNVLEIGCDFYVFGAHKLFGPTGIGVLWGRRELLEAMPPYQGGGDMIETVSFEKTTYADLPNRLEAGTPDIAGAIGLGAAIDYVQQLGFETIQAIEDDLLEYCTQQLSQVPGLRILGKADRKASVVSFVLENPSIAPMDVASSLATEGIAIRTGHHCCMPLMGHLQVSGTNRVSMAMYNTRGEIDRMTQVLLKLVASRSKESSQESGGNESDSAGGESGMKIAFGPSKASSVAEAADELAEEFLEFDDRESKTELLMEIGQAVPDGFEDLKRISTAVPGCMSEVYLVGRPKSDTPDCFEFAADSNAEVVRGLIGVLLHLYSGQRADDILAFDMEGFFRRIGLDQFVSTQRRSGLNGMIQRIRTLAEAILERQSGESS